MRFTKREIIVGISGFAVAVLLGGMFLWWHSQGDDKKASAKQTVGNHEISLNQSDESSDSGGLGVSGTASDLGQLGDKSSKKDSSSANSSGGTDTSSFAQYDKYQNEKNGLFGEIKPGTGATLDAGKKASIYYKVWLTNGTLVDQSPTSSGGQRQPFGFTLGGHQVIPGLEQGIFGMKVGGQRLIIVPPAVGYGAQGQGSIPPNAVLVFQVELTGVQ